MRGAAKRVAAVVATALAALAAGYVEAAEIKVISVRKGGRAWRFPAR
jgi:hypothetical protein